MRSSGIFVLVVSLLGLSACKPPITSSDLKITVGPTPVQLLPIDLASCKASDKTAKDVKSPSFELTTFNFQWTGANFFKFAYMQIDVKSPYLTGGKYQCFISGDELSYVVYPKQAGIAGADDTPYKANCSLRCGGMTVNSSLSVATFNGTLRVVGTQVDADGNGEVVSAEKDVVINYTNPNGSL